MSVTRSSLAPLCLVFLAGLTAAGALPAQPAAGPPSSLDDLARRSLARIAGELRVSGLKQPVEIIRDRQGIPHIYARNDDDLFFAQGYVMAAPSRWTSSPAHRARGV